MNFDFDNTRKIFESFDQVYQVVKMVDNLAKQLDLPEVYTVDDIESKLLPLITSKPLDLNGELKDIENALDCAHDSIYEVESAADEIKGYGRSLDETKSSISSSLEDITMALKQIKDRQTK
jgi:hypothetical protein